MESDYSIIDQTFFPKNGFPQCCLVIDCRAWSQIRHADLNTATIDLTGLVAQRLRDAVFKRLWEIIAACNRFCLAFFLGTTAGLC